SRGDVTRTFDSDSAPDTSASPTRVDDGTPDPNRTKDHDPSFRSAVEDMERFLASVPLSSTKDTAQTSPPGGPSGRYEVLEEVGRGGMGCVLRARDPVLGRDLALKVLRSPHAGPEAVRRFVEEAQVGGQLQHPGLVPVYELGRFDDGRPYFTMKLV